MSVIVIVRHTEINLNGVNGAEDVVVGGLVISLVIGHTAIRVKSARMRKGKGLTSKK